MRPIQLKLALLFCLIGLIIDLVYIPLNKELYQGQWIMVFGVKAFISFLWLISFILISRGFGGLRFVYTVFVLWAIGRILFSGALAHLDIFMISSLLLSIAGVVLWFLPVSNDWFKSKKEAVS